MKIKSPKAVDPRKDPAFKPDTYAAAYEYARTGLTLAQIASALGVPSAKFKAWLRADRCLYASVKRGRASSSTLATAGQTFLDYVYLRLPPDLQAVYDKIDPPDRLQEPVKDVEELLRDKGQKFRMHLFVHALVASAFNPSEACRKVGVSKAQLDRWVKQEPGFAELVQEILWHEKNFVKGALFAGIARGDASLIKFAAQAKLKDEGYGGEVEVRHSGGVGHLHLTGEEYLAALPVEKRQEMLDRMRQQKAPPAIGGL